jgi:hypothetical protein
MQTTIKQLIREVSDIAANHQQIKSFYYGEPLSIIKGRKVNFTSLWMNISVSSFDEKKTTFNIELFCMDRVNKDDRNKTDVENTTSRILRDIYNIVRFSTRWQDFGELVQQVQNQKYYDYTADRVTGWGQTISFNVWNTDCFADLPMGDYDFNQTIPIDVCDVLAIVKNSDNDTLATKLVIDSDNIITIPNISFTDSDGTVTSEPSGVNLVCTPSADATYDLNNTLGTTLSSGSIPSGDNATILAPNSTYTLQNTTPTTLGTGSIASGVNGVITVGITKLEVLNTVPNLVLSTNLPSGVPAQVTAPNGTIRNNVTPTYSVAVPSGATVTLPQITVTDSDGSTYLQDSVTNVTCTPGGGSGDVTVNGSAFGTYTAPTTFDVNIIDELGDPYLTLDITSPPTIRILAVNLDANNIPLTDIYQGGNYNINVLSRNGTAIGNNSGGDVIVTNPLKGNFQANVGVLADYVMTAEDAGTYTTLTDDGASGTVTILINGGALVLPYNGVAGDIVSSSRSINTAAGWYKLN